MKFILVAATMAMTFTACHQLSIGYLITEYASYEVDSLLVKSQLDLTPPEVIPNEEYQLYLSFGATHEELLSMGIYPTISVGGGEDYERHRLGIPWVSAPIEGLQGTMPILASIKHVTADGGGDVAELLQYLSVRGNGVFSIPVEHDIPPGRYLISLTFTNEGYSKSVDDVFTIIVK